MKTIPINFLVCCIAISFSACNKEVPSAKLEISETIPPDGAQVYFLVNAMDSTYMKRLHFEAVMKGYASSY